MLRHLEPEQISPCKMRTKCSELAFVCGIELMSEKKETFLRPKINFHKSSSLNTKQKPNEDWSGKPGLTSVAGLVPSVDCALVCGGREADISYDGQ